MQENWGYQRLAHKGKDESFGEMRHAEELIERILYLEGVPNMQRLFPVKIGETVPEQLGAELETEKEAITRLSAGIEQCRRTDEGTRLLLEQILHDEEEHADWLETQLSMITDLGEGLYLNAQIHDE
jgi:bacterioferritin